MKQYCKEIGMKRIFILLSFLFVGHTFLFAQQDHVNIDWDPQRNKENLVPLSARVISPEVLDDKSVIFRLHGPDVKEVYVSGSMFVGDEARKRVPMTKGEDGIWSVRIEPLDPNIYLYYFQVDGVNMNDPNNTLTGHANMPAFSMLWVHGDGPAFYDARNVPHGAITQHFYYSPVTEGERYLLVYTPPGYDPAKKYPVLYLMGGSGDLPETWTMHGQVNFIMDNLLAEGKAIPMIIVIPNNQVVHRMHPQHTELSFPIMEREYKEAIIPFVEKHYSVISDRHARAISGLSMGGRHTQYIGLRNLDLFGSLGILSAAIAIDETPVLREPDVNDKIDYLFLGAGTYETNPRARHQVFHEELEKLGVKHEYYVGSRGAHDLIAWRHLLYYRFLPNLWRNPEIKIE
ncbi:enterochelin esterase-like enzyme [Parabacteroides sp. PFB2-12]|nr:enterochelin esterase-like enzyme [Parabacteroides sp. PM6-13]MDH6390012.1 enterochelin esterase-like enzyme [Parabacteroides sp. PFB2-12]